MPSRLSHFFQDVSDWFFPRLCLVCGQPMLRYEQPMCLTCLLNLPLVEQKSSCDNVMLRTLWPYAPVEHGLSLVYYRSATPYHRLVMDFKSGDKALLAWRLGAFAATLLAHHGLAGWADAVVPVPLGMWRQLRRGYNQAEQLARGVAKVYGLEVWSDLLTRRHTGHTQSSLRREQRRENAKNLYEAHFPPSKRGKHLLLVDDVCTTGATLGNCATAILQADPTARVSVFVLAWAGNTTISAGLHHIAEDFMPNSEEALYRLRHSERPNLEVHMK